MTRKQTQDKQRLLEQLAKTPIVEAACKQAAVPRSTYYRWYRDDEEFAAACDEAIALSASRISDLAESQLIAAIKDQNMTAITFWLKHHHPVYETRIKVDASLKREAEELSPEQTAVVEQALRNAGLLPVNRETVEKAPDGQQQLRF